MTSNLWTIWKVCPWYTAVLAGSEDDGIDTEELDTLQLETLLSSASRQLHVLEAETQILTDWQDKKGYRRFLKLGRDRDLGAPPIKGNPRSRNWKGRQHMGQALTQDDSNSKTFNPRSRTMNLLMIQSMCLGSPRMMLPTGSVEPYCAVIISKEVPTREELLKPPEDEAEHYKILPLGKYYSQCWAQEDLLEEQKDGAWAAAVADKKKGLIGSLMELDTKRLPC